jgi:hypothetical protein
MLKEISLKQLIWLLPIVYLVHNIEEGLTMVGWLGDHSSALPELFGKLLPERFWEKFDIIRSLALVIAVLLPLVLAFLHRYKEKYKFILLLFVLAGWFTFINGVQHVIFTLVLQTYTPGIVTALFINLPFSLGLIISLEKEYPWLHVQRVKWLVLSIICYLPLIFVIWALATLLSILF